MTSTETRDKAAAEYMKSNYDYHFDGYFVSKVQRRGMSMGSVFKGSLHYSGYRYCRIIGRFWSFHRLVYLYHNGFVPKELDHLNRNKSDNRIENLRPASKTQNGLNTKTRRSKYGVRGLRFNHGKWVGELAYNNKKILTKRCETREEAIRLIIAKRKELSGEFYVE